MTMTTSPLDAAREALRQQLGALADGDWMTRRWLNPLHDVADMVCRIGDHDHSSYYQADKAGDMVKAALRVRRACQERYADQDCADERPMIEKLAHDLTEVADEVESAIENALWSSSGLAHEGKDGRVREANIYQLRDAARKLERLADRLAPTAEPDLDYGE